jgi:RNA polymerase sigma-70 factor, ECF subfamily
VAQGAESCRERVNLCERFDASKGRWVHTVDSETHAAIERLYREEGWRLWWALVAYSGDRDVASDASAEAFAQALARADEIRDPKAWIWTVAFRVAAGELKRRRTTDHRIPDVPDPAPRSAQELVAVLRRLPDQQRAAIVLHYYADRSVADIAQTIGVSPATPRVRLHRGRRRLKQLLEDEDD